MTGRVTPGSTARRGGRQIGVDVAVAVERGPARRPLRLGLRVTPALLLAAVIVAVGVGATVVRPLAPALDVSADAARWFPDQVLARIESYATPRRAVGLVLLAATTAVPVLVAATARGRRGVDRLVRVVRRPVPAGAAVAVAVTVAVYLARLPFVFWSSFVHDGQWGLRTQGFGGWARDWALAVGTEVLGAALIGAGAVMVLRRWPDRAGRVGGLLAVALLVVLVWLRPLAWEPLRFDFRPLGEGPVRAEVERVLAAAGEQVDEIRVADASRRSTRQNAYVSGLGPTRHVVLYDTLLEGRTPQEVGVILAHELGHRQAGDIWRGTAAGAAGTIVVSGLLAAFLRWRVRTGRQRTLADPRGVAAAMALLAVLQVASLPVQQYLSRRAEAAADLAALRIADAPDVYVGMQQGLVEANLTDPDPPGWSRLLWGSHPAPVDRLAMARAYAEGHLR